MAGPERSNKRLHCGALTWGDKQMRAMMLLVAVSALAACTKVTEQQPVTTIAASPMELQASESPRTLSPLIAAATECLTLCKTVFKSTPDTREYLDSRLPHQFNEWAKTHQDSLMAAVAKLPAKFMPLVVREPDDDPLFQMNRASLNTVIQQGDTKVYIYRHVGFSRRELHSLLNVAIDESTHETAAIVTANPNQDEYFLSGPQRLQAVLLAELAIEEMVDAKASLERAHKDEAWSPSPIYRFPLDGAFQSMGLERLTHFNTVLRDGNMQGVLQPDDRLEEQRIREAAAWYGVSSTETSCVSTSFSPAKRIQFIREAGIQPETRDTLDAAGNLRIVEVSAYESGHTRTWRYFKRESDCVASLPINGAPIPDRYR